MPLHHQFCKNLPNQKVNEYFRCLTIRRSQFTELFDDFKYEDIRNQILTRQLRTCPFTSVLWRVFLHCLPRTSNQWDLTIDISREHFTDLCAKYNSDPQSTKQLGKEQKNDNHPLSQDEYVLRIESNFIQTYTCNYSVLFFPESMESTFSIQRFERKYQSRRSTNVNLKIQNKHNFLFFPFFP